MGDLKLASGTADAAAPAAVPIADADDGVPDEDEGKCCTGMRIT